MSTPQEETSVAYDTAEGAPLPRAWQHRAPSDAEIHRDWAEQVIADLPAGGTGCATPDQRLAAAQAHALLSLAARVAELIDAIRDGTRDISGELETMRCQGISEVGVTGSVWVSS